jgi:hypothetical protein
MPTDCVWRDLSPYSDPAISQDMYTGQHLVGYAWFDDPEKRKFWGDRGLSQHYLRDIAPFRLPITVILPTRQGGQITFLVDGHPTDKPDEAWQVDVDLASLVAGQKPDITVTPSINCVGLYHGFLQAGVITDDLGG